MLHYILLLGLILRLLSINQSFWLDEATTANVMRELNLSQIVTQFSPGDFHPPLYYLFLKVYSSLVGTSEVALRSFSVLSGLGTIAVVYHIGKKLGSRSGANLAALLMATSPLGVYYSQEARMYALATFFVSLSVLAFIHITQKAKTGHSGGGYSWLLIFILSSFGAYFTLYPTIFMIAVFLVLTKSKKILLAHLVILGLFVPFVSLLLRQIEAGVGVSSEWGRVLGSLNIKNLGLIPAKFLIGRISFDNKLLYACVVALGGAVYGLGISKVGKYKILLYWLLIPLVLGAILSLKLPILSYFRFLFVLPALYLLAALGLQKLKSIYFLPAVLAILFFNLACTLIYLNNDKFHREDWKGLTQTLKDQSKDFSYKIIFPAKSQMEAIKYYWPDSNVSGGSDSVEEGLDQLWYIRYVPDIVDSQESARSKIEGLGYKKQEELDFNGITVWKYTKI